MNTVFELSEKEIAKIIAAYMECSVEDVSIEYENRIVGYGQNEHDEVVVGAVVRTSGPLVVGDFREGR